MVLKRVNMDENTNYELGLKAKDMNMSHDEFIQEAVKFYVDHLNNPRQEEDIYTLRMNQLTEEVNRLRHDMAGGYQSIKNKLDTISVFGADINYLNDDLK